MCFYDSIRFVYNGYLTTCKYKNSAFFFWRSDTSPMYFACFFSHLQQILPMPSSAFLRIYASFVKMFLSTELLLQLFRATATVQLYLQLISICVSGCLFSCEARVDCWLLAGHELSVLLRLTFLGFDTDVCYARRLIEITARAR